MVATDIVERGDVPEGVKSEVDVDYTAEDCDGLECRSRGSL